MEVITILLLCFHTLFTCTKAASDTLSTNQTIRDGETIVSPQQTFELGFFSPSNTSQNRYLGIWYKQLATRTVVWVANRETPLTSNNSGELTLAPGGLLVLRDSTNNQIIWSSNSNTSRETGNNNVVVVARLLDDSNFMVVDSSTQDGPDDYIWQSFDHPGNTMMPGMKFGRNLKRGVVTNYTSWKSDDDPSPGEFMVYMDSNGLPQIFQKDRDEIQYRLGSWNGVAFGGSTNNHPNPTYRTSFYMDAMEISAVLKLINKSVLTKLTVTPDGNMGQWNWNNRTRRWFLYSSMTMGSCKRYALCGVHGICDISQSPNCGCLRGFTPKRPGQWKIGDWTNGCRREIPLADCGAGEGFRKYPFVKIPDTRGSWFDRNMSLEECRMKCSRQCNCTAYAALDIKQGSGCLLWYNDLIDMRTLPNNGQDIYIRMSAAALEKDRRRIRSKKIIWYIITPVSLGLVILLGLCVTMIVKKKKKKKTVKAQGRSDEIIHKDGFDLPLFSLSTLIVATDNFSIGNKLGEGGFGPVYKGFLENGVEIAVKRLSRVSTQGVEEFKNEVIFISKLQHRNLVKILGYCVKGPEKLLVYEFMPNNSLDLLLFGTKRKILNWSQRYHIINGIARGLLYLHQDSHLRIIHRDLKAANILLDHEMNPKISDFGLARRFGGNETETNTIRVVGTYGYMAPEYAGDEFFSTKSDVFSFGVLVLEVVSGKKNRQFLCDTYNHNLVGHVWRLYKEGKSLALADESLIESSDLQMLRLIHIALLCVQHSPEDRPDMSMVVLMLSSDRRLPEPRQPGYYIELDKFGPENSSNMQTQISNSYITVSHMAPK
ncbi:hypothetical protein SSX86_003040 [Deinandra increscens subsp. villosa]|uniref:Receptor-like serine/threonine-protein kinase n=1 Tax=Deinandra increscens subsp. villosa TaxID=3103831 RepID=A0AAP0DL37_9ASTR